MAESTSFKAISFDIGHEPVKRQRKYYVNIKRAAYTYDAVEDKYPQTGEIPKRRRKSFPSYLPITAVLKGTDWRQSMWADVTAGLSVAFLHMPQGLAYGLLASLSPVSGLYTSFFSVLMYVLYGTCPHLSMGTNSVLSLATAAMVEREVELTRTGNHSDILTDETAIMDYKLGVAQASTLVSGAILLSMGVFRMGFLTSYMPSSFIGGFTTGAAVHIATSQVKHVFHIPVPTYSGAGKILFTYRDLAMEVANLNFPDTVVCAISAFFLLSVSMYGNPKLKAKYGFDIPINLVVVLLGTAISFATSMNQQFGVAIIGNVPAGFPLPSLPNFAVLPNIILDSIVLAVITFAMSIAMAMLMARIHEYEVDSNTELIAYGVCNITSSFFPSQASSASPPRSMILSNVGSKTMLHGIPTALFLLATFLFAGNLFSSLPIAVLAAMILVAVKDLLLQVRQIPVIWRISKSDFAVWTLTCAVTTFVDLPFGIIVGVLTSVFSIILNNQNIKGTLVVMPYSEDLLIPGQYRRGVYSPNGIRIFYFPSQLVYANAENFRNQIFHEVFDPTSVTEVDFELPDDEERLLSEEVEMEMVTRKEVRCIIIDCSAMTYIDLDGVNMLKLVVLRYRKVGVQILLARCADNAMQMLERAGFFSLLPRTCIFHDVIDAVRSEEDTREGVSRLSLANFPGMASTSSVYSGKFLPSRSTGLFSDDIFFE